MITKIDIFRENILVPRNLDERKTKQKANNMKMLQQEEIESDEFFIDDSYANIKNVKCKKITADVILTVTKIPEWLSGVIINGTLELVNMNIKNLVGCPQVITGSFSCSGQGLESLVGGPVDVRSDYYCSGNYLQNLDGHPKYVGGNFDCTDNEVLLQQPPDSEMNLMGEFTNEY